MVLKRASQVAQNPPSMQKTFPWVGKIPWRKKWQALQYFRLEDATTEKPGWAIVHRVANESDDTEAT